MLGHIESVKRNMTSTELGVNEQRPSVLPDEDIQGAVIAGGGPVALVTGLMLARAGVRVTVLEAEPAIVPSPRAIVYHAPTVAVLDRLGVLQDATRQGILKQDYHFRSVRGEIHARLDMAVLDGHTDYPYNLHLGQDLLAAILREHLLASGMADLRWGHRVRSVRNEPDKVLVDVETAEGLRRLRTAWLVGADGARSAVRQSLGLAFDGITWPERFVAINLRHDFESHGWARANFVIDPQDWAIVPVLDRHTGWRVTYGESADLPLESVAQRAPERLARILPGGDPAAIDLIAPYRVHQRCAESFRVGRVLLAGDAAHITNPCGGLGLTSGILDAEHLGLALAAVMQGGADERILDCYAAERRRIFLEVASPAASENKRRLAEADPGRRAADLARLKRLNADQDFQRETLLATTLLVSRAESLPV